METVPIKDVAVAMGVTPLTVRRWCDLGMIESSKTLGGVRRIPASELDRLLSGGVPAEPPKVVAAPVVKKVRKPTRVVSGPKADKNGSVMAGWYMKPSDNEEEGDD